MEGGEEVWTTDKEARGRAERKQRYMDTVMGEEDFYRPETDIKYILSLINSQLLLFAIMREGMCVHF